MRPGPPPLQITVQLDGLMDLVPDDRGSRDAAFATLRRSAFLGAEFMRAIWQRVAGAMDIRGSFGGGQASYVQGIRAAQVTVEEEANAGDTFSIRLALQNASPHAEFVENGHGAFSLPRAIRWGETRGSIKRGPNGPYLHIPFRHFAFASAAEQESKGYTRHASENMMPRDVSAAAAQLTRRLRTNNGPVYRDMTVHDVTVGGARGTFFDGHRGLLTPSGGRAQQFVAADRYTWDRAVRATESRRLTRNSVPGLLQMGAGGVVNDEQRGATFVGRGRGGPLSNPAWQTSKFEGLFKSGPKGHTSYMTIRTITPHSLGWNIPAQAGRHVARRVAHELTYGQTREALEKIVIDPFLAALLNGGASLA